MASSRTQEKHNAKTKEAKRYTEYVQKPQWKDWFRCILLFLLVPFTAFASQLSLSPIYGAIPPTRYHVALQMASWTLAGLLSQVFGSPSSKFLYSILPLHMWTAPAVSHYVFAPLSGRLGPRFGPLAEEIILLCPIILLTGVSILNMVTARFPRLENNTTSALALVLCLLVSYVVEVSLPPLYNSILPSRWAIQTALATVCSLNRPSIYLLATIPAMSFQLTLNSHAPFRSNDLDRVLASRYAFNLLARTESNTGYVSVLENTHDAIRLLRCDHSLLGGVWLPTPERVKQGISVPEPIYPVFTMLEAVRLMHPADAHVYNKSQQALVVGLGIGTAPAALTHHGITTTVLEIDPAVTRYARNFFNLPSNVSVITTDAVPWVTESTAQIYDYIIHDTFTGGAEPLPLFTFDFLNSLHNLLKLGGMAAINYAGDLHSQTTLEALARILKAFHGNCRFFREDEPPSPSKHSSESDFTNVVAFCMRSDGSDETQEGKVTWAFRPPIEKDFLQSVSRRNSLPPRFEVQHTFKQREELLATTEKRKATARLHKTDEEQLQIKSAEAHWHIMRSVLPSGVWQLW